MRCNSYEAASLGIALAVAIVIVSMAYTAHVLTSDNVTVGIAGVVVYVVGNLSYEVASRNVTAIVACIAVYVLSFTGETAALGVTLGIAIA